MFLDFFVIYFFIKKIKKKSQCAGKNQCARANDKPGFFLYGLTWKVCKTSTVQAFVNRLRFSAVRVQISKTKSVRVLAIYAEGKKNGFLLLKYYHYIVPHPPRYAYNWCKKLLSLSLYTMLLPFLSSQFFTPSNFFVSPLIPFTAHLKRAHSCFSSTLTLLLKSSKRNLFPKPYVITHVFQWEEVCLIQKGHKRKVYC